MMTEGRLLLPDGRDFGGGRTLVMGILNVTPDSFSDGGRFDRVDVALERAATMLAEGADFVDVGGESTRPGSVRIDPDEEWRRIGPVVDALASEGVVVSVDTLHAVTAVRAAEAGALIVNDVSGGRWDPRMNAAVADTGRAFIVQHYRALPGMPGESFDYGPDVLTTLMDEMSEQADEAIAAGVRPEAVVLDPGLGFSLTNEQCMDIIECAGTLNRLGFPVLIGASRKRFVAALGGDRDEQTAMITRHCAREGIWAVRVHEIAANARAAHEGSEERE